MLTWFPPHLFLSVGEFEVVDEETEWEQLGQGGETKHWQELQTEHEVLGFCIPELQFEGEVLFWLPEVTTE